MEEKLLEKHDERVVRYYDLKYKKFTASIALERFAFEWAYVIKDKNGIKIDEEVKNHFMSELEIHMHIKTRINDCIRNPAEYYDQE